MAIFDLYEPIPKSRSLPVLKAFKRLAGRIIASYSEYRRLRDQRDAFKTMLTLDDRQLVDIGVTRGDVEYAAGLPLEVNAALVLKQLKVERSL